MMRFLKRWCWLLLIALLAGIYWLLPTRGTVLISSLPLDPDAHFPQFVFEPSAPQPGDEVLVQVTDNVPWTHVELMVNDTLAEFVHTQALPLRQQWNWTWRFQVPSAAQKSARELPATTLAFYRDCNSGCRLRDQRTLEPFITANQSLPTKAGIGTKLCVAFPDPDRQWHGRSGWVMDLTYATTDVAYWQIDALAQRVWQSQVKGLKVLVRVDYAPEQSLPPTNDEEALSLYLTHIEKLARDERLTNVYAYIIGTGFNATDSNMLSSNLPTTPAWYAHLFNGPNAEATVAQIVRANNPVARVLVGPVRPWIADQDGSRAFEIDAPWLNYMNTLVALVDKNTQQNSAAGIPLTGPDGFALNVPGNPDGLADDEIDLAEEPRKRQMLAEFDDAQGGFRLYEEWLAIINGYPSTSGKPAFITSTNTFVFGADLSDGEAISVEAMPAANYPRGWLTTALTVINEEPQIESLCWFLDQIPGDQRWQGFSLAQGEGRMADLSKEFDQLLKMTK